MKSILPVLVYLLSVLTAFSQTDSTIRLMFIGDVMGHSPQIQSAYDSTTGRYDYTDVFSELNGLLRVADFAIANLEVTLAGEPYSGYPQFSSPDELVDGLMAAGVNVLVTANNHSVDRGGAGIKRTIEVLQGKGIPHTGTFLDSADKQNRNPIIIEKSGIRLALLNYTYGTNGLVVPSPYLVNMIDTVAMSMDFARAKEFGVDDIIVFIHWGNEYERFPNKYQQNLATWMQKKGVRIVIGSHPHVVQKSELSLTEDDYRLVVYSLGNFVSNQRKRYCDGGIIAYLELKRTANGVNVSGAGYIPVWVNVYTNSIGKKKYKVLPVSVFEADAGSYLSAASDSAFKTFINDTRELLNGSNTNYPEVRFDGGQWVFPTLNR